MDSDGIRSRPPPDDSQRSWNAKPSSRGSPTSAHPLSNGGGGGGGSLNGAAPSTRLPQPVPPSVSQSRTYTLMTAGQRSGKTSFLRLLLDTSDIAPSATQDQLASVARFIQGCGGHTSHIRTAVMDVAPEPGRGDARGAPITLALVDTPSLDFSDELAADQMVSQILQHVDSRFAESLENDAKAPAGDHHVHLCLYFLDPDAIVPPSAAGAAAAAAALPQVSRSRAGSLSQIAPSALTLEPPVPTNPALCRPTLPRAEVEAIRRLSARVNVLPVVARADTLTNERLGAVKLAIRRDLAEAGIGFGIFDTDFTSHEDGQTRSPPVSASTLQLPYALISPEQYAHSDGTLRPTPSRHEIVQQYMPPKAGPAAYAAHKSKLARGRFTRTFRWGALDVLDPRHCDFVPLRASVFYHMDTLVKYTRDYLYEKFREDVQQQRLTLQDIPRPRRESVSQQQQQQQQSQNHGFPHGVSLSPEQRLVHPVDGRLIGHHRQASSLGGSLSNNGLDRDPQLGSGGERHHHHHHGSSSKQQRSKKITVACNFCRSRKLKCDGGRPACSQCVKRAVPCDYQPHVKRRGPGKYKVPGADDSDEASGDEDDSEEMREAPDGVRDYADQDRWTDRDDRAQAENGAGGGDYAHARYGEPSRSPEVEMRYTQPPPQRQQPPPSLSTHPGGPNGTPYPPMREDVDVYGGRSRANTASTTSSVGGDGHYIPGGGEHRALGHLAMMGSSAGGLQLPPLQPHNDGRPSSGNGMSATPSAGGTKRRASETVFVKGHRPPAAGSKVVACNFCRARKTKCDSVHPTCSSCQRRQLPCSYANDPPSTRGSGSGPGVSARKTSSASASATSSVGPEHSGPPPSAHGQPYSLSTKSASTSPPHSQSHSHSHANGSYVLARPDRNVDMRMDVDDTVKPPSAKRLRLDGGGGGFESSPMPVAIPSQ